MGRPSEAELFPAAAPTNAEHTRMMTPSTPLSPFTPFRSFAPAPAPVVPRPSEGPAKEPSVALRIAELSPRIGKVVRAVLGFAHPDLEDVTQEALLAVIQALPSFRGECEPKHFASRIAARVAIASARRARTARARREDDVDVDLFRSEAAAPLDETVHERQKDMLRGLLTRIPDEQAETLVLRVVLGWSLPEIAASTGVPLNTVRSRVRLAKNALRAAIDADPTLAEELVQV